MTGYRCSLTSVIHTRCWCHMRIGDTFFRMLQYVPPYIHLSNQSISLFATTATQECSIWIFHRISSCHSTSVARGRAALVVCTVLYSTFGNVLAAWRFGLFHSFVVHKMCLKYISYTSLKPPQYESCHRLTSTGHLHQCKRDCWRLWCYGDEAPPGSLGRVIPGHLVILT